MPDLTYVLRHLPPQQDPRLLVGNDPADDAGIYRLADDLALVQSVDFFTPIVDDPYDYGSIAAANSLSDIYAMGGTPLTALNIVGFPVRDVSMEVLTEILRGGAETARKAGVTIVGGHTVDDPEPKYGLAVTGTVNPKKYLSAHGAKPSDILVLTKPIGTGVIATAIKDGAATASHVRQATEWMTSLNAKAAKAMVEIGVNAVTDITGFGILGHLVLLCKASEVAARIFTSRVPLLPGAMEYARRNYSPAGTETNREYTGEFVQFDADVDEEMRRLLADPQTSGGLLISMPENRLQAFHDHVGTEALAAPIGKIESGEAGHIVVSQSSRG